MNENLMPTKEKFAELAQAILQSASVARHDDRLSIPYRPRMNKITGGIISTILLQQIEFYWTANKARPFYKFAAPCSHELYREGDSWYEELDLGRSEFEAARDKIATKIKRKVSKKAARNYRDDQGRLQKPDHLVLYWTDSSLITWYEFNADLMNAYTLMAYHGFSEEEVLMYLDHMYGVAEMFGADNNDNDENEDSSPENDAPSEILTGNVKNQQSLIPETHRDSELKANAFNVAATRDSNLLGSDGVGVNPMFNRKTNGTPQSENKPDPINQYRNTFDSMKRFAESYNTTQQPKANLPKPTAKPLDKPAAEKPKVKVVKVEKLSEEDVAKSEVETEVKPKTPRKKSTSSTGRAEYKEWLIAVLDLFNLASAFNGRNYNDSTVAAYSKTAKNMRLMAMEYSERNPDKAPIEATIVRQFFEWMKKKGWKDIGQKALVERFPEYIASISDKPVDAPFRITQLKKWILAEEKHNNRSVSDEEREKLQELVDIEIITNYHQLKNQIPQEQRQRLEKGLSDGSIYNPFN